MARLGPEHLLVDGRRDDFLEAEMAVLRTQEIRKFVEHARAIRSE